VARVENTMRDVYSGFVVRFGGSREFSLFDSHKNDSLKSSQQLASVQIVGVESGSYIVDIRKKEKFRNCSEEEIVFRSALMLSLAV
jgi:hypothetical protein